MASISNACPDIVNYTIQDQKELDYTLKEINKPIINRFIIDYGNLRDKLRYCYE